MSNLSRHRGSAPIAKLVDVLTRPGRSLRSRARTVYERHWLKMPPRHSNPYATHTPIFMCLSRLLNVSNVLEFGSGLFSTPAWLVSNNGHIKYVESYENDGEWAAEVKEKLAGDSRVNLVTVNGRMGDAAIQVDVDSFQLTIVDDSTRPEERLATIKAVAAQRPSRTVTAIHDFEHPTYRHAANSGFEHTYRFTCVNPNVGVAWNGSRDLLKALRGIEQEIRLSLDSLAIEDVDAWVEFADQNVKAFVEKSNSMQSQAA